MLLLSLNSKITFSQVNKESHILLQCENIAKQNPLYSSHWLNNCAPSNLPFDYIDLICMQSVEQTKLKWRKKRSSAPAMCTVLFMKALPGTMETNYLLTMWNRILFTRLRFPLLFQMRFFTASSFVSHSIIVSIFQKQSVSRKEQKKRKEWITAVHKTCH